MRATLVTGMAVVDGEVLRSEHPGAVNLDTSRPCRPLAGTVTSSRVAFGRMSPEIGARIGGSALPAAPQAITAARYRPAADSGASPTV